MVEEDKNKKHNKKEIKEDTMEKEKTIIFIEEKVIIFIIGFLIGAIVATSGCIIYNKITAKSNTPTAIQNNWNNNQPPGMNDQPPGMNDHRNKRNNPNRNEETQGEKLLGFIDPYNQTLYFQRPKGEKKVDLSEFNDTEELVLYIKDVELN
jgi:hypothetical protein